MKSRLLKLKYNYINIKMLSRAFKPFISIILKITPSIWRFRAPTLQIKNNKILFKFYAKLIALFHVIYPLAMRLHKQHQTIMKKHMLILLMLNVMHSKASKKKRDVYLNLQKLSLRKTLFYKHGLMQN